MGDMTILCPGVGFQQKDVPMEQQVAQTVKAAMNSKKQGFLINLSRSVLYASGADNFADIGAAEVVKVNELFEKYRN